MLSFEDTFPTATLARKSSIAIKGRSREALECLVAEGRSTMAEMELKERYNALLDVEVAHASFQANPAGQATLQRMGKALEEANLHRLVGIRLLHRHNALADGQAMVENRETLPDGRMALVTSVQAADDLEACVPVIWTMGPIDLLPLEYCNRDLAEVDDEFFWRTEPRFSAFFKLPLKTISMGYWAFAC